MIEHNDDVEYCFARLPVAGRSSEIASLAGQELAVAFTENFKQPDLKQLLTEAKAQKSGRVLVIEAIEKLGKVEDQRHVDEVGACFVAGTLVHTDKGLVPIEKLKIGDLVLSQPEGGGEKAYKPVVRTMVHDDKDVCAIRYYDLGGDTSTTTTIFATENHPFWVEDIGWTQARDLADGHILQLANGNQGLVAKNLPMYRTSNTNLACEYDEDINESHCLEFDATGLIALPKGEIDLDILYSKDPYFKIRVYNIEVADFHTYFIEEEGIWVHNANCPDVKTLNPEGTKPPADTPLFGVRIPEGQVLHLVL